MVQEHWYYSEKGRREGPVLESWLLGMFEVGDLGPETLVWSESLEGWTRASEVEAFKSRFTPSHPSRPQKPSPVSDPKPKIKAKPETIHVPIKGNGGMTEKYWYYLKDGKREGPIPESELLEMFKAEDLDLRTLVQTESMKYWRPAPHIKSLRAIIESSLPSAKGQLPNTLSRDLTGKWSKSGKWFFGCGMTFLGFLVMISLPCFLAYQKKDLTTEAKQELWHIRTIQMAYNAEELMYGSFTNVGWIAPTGKTRYMYSLSWSATTFLARAAGNLDGDDTIDTWTINQNNTLAHLVDDLKY